MCLGQTYVILLIFLIRSGENEVRSSPNALVAQTRLTITSRFLRYADRIAPQGVRSLIAQRNFNMHIGFFAGSKASDL
jgi:hypothetical protein